jgi:hypothetical protein
MRYLRFLTCGLLLGAVFVSAKHRRYAIPVSLESKPAISLEYLDRAQATALTNPRSQRGDRLCRLHQMVMSVRTVPIVYGLLAFSKWGGELAYAENADFPNARDYVSGGCMPDSIQKAYVFECDECRQRKHSWLAAHPKPDDNEKPKPGEL